jgi:glycosyltransferase involved in cell wall biosynthesis
MATKPKEMPRTPMKILFTGNYLVDYNRTKIIADGLKKLGHTIMDLPFTKKSTGIKNKLLELEPNVDLIFLPSFTHNEVKWVKSICKHKPLAFDPLISRYLTKVYDYKLVSPWGISALRNYWRDKTPMSVADLVFTDTEQHKNYFHKKFKIPKEKMEVLYIGNSFDDFKPIPKIQHTKLKVGFYGGFIPLQGVMQILKAIEILRNEDIDFELIGNGFEYQKAIKYIQEKNLNFISLPGWISQDELAKRINTYDIALGIFGLGEKTNLVIPNKVYHYASSDLAIISKDTPAIREIFTDKEDIYLVEGSPESIAKAILDLKANPNLRKALARNALNKMQNEWNETKIAEIFLQKIRRLLR